LFEHAQNGNVQTQAGGIQSMKWLGRAVVVVIAATVLLLAQPT